MKLLVLGASGMAGHVISLHFIQNGFEVDTFTRRPFAFGRNILGDARDLPAVSKLVEQGGYDAVINCIGLLNRNAEEQQADAAVLNGCLPHVLAEALDRSNGGRLIHMSTDCVFSGEKGGYTEDSFCDGPTFYDRSKALGEVRSERHLTFRNSIIGPDMSAQGIGLLNWFLRQSGPLKGFRRAIWSGVSTVILARAMQRALETNLTGLYQLGNNTPINKYDLLGLFNKHFRGGALEISPEDSFVCDKSLTSTRTDFDFVVPGYDEMVAQTKSWMLAHREIYPHYVF